jgi:hypothetical protein
LIDRSGVNVDAVRDKFRVKSVDVVDADVGYAAGNTVAGK